MREVNLKILLPEFILVLGRMVKLGYRRLRFGCAFRRIPLTQGRYAIVEPADYEWLSRYKWFAIKTERGYYAVRAVSAQEEERRQYQIRMHREIMGDIPKGKIVDHRNQNGLDNRRSNLRNATSQENSWNKRKQKGRYSSKYKGVSWFKGEGRWQARITKDSKQIFIGYFDDEQEAARAYDAKAKELFGEFAAVNFPERRMSRFDKWSFRICYGRYTG